MQGTEDDIRRRGLLQLSGVNGRANAATAWLDWS
jgi:hypothetical protein